MKTSKYWAQWMTSVEAGDDPEVLGELDMGPSRRRFRKWLGSVESAKMLDVGQLFDNDMKTSARGR